MKKLLIFPNSEETNYKIDNVTKLRLWFKDVSLLQNVTEQIVRDYPVFAVFNSEVSASPIHRELEGCHGFVEIIPLESGKSNAIKFLAQEKEILLGNIVTVGDGSNDLDMVKDFDGYAIEGSALANVNIRPKTISSLAELVEGKLMNDKGAS